MLDKTRLLRRLAAGWIAAMQRHRFDVLLGALLLLLLAAPVVRLLGPERSPRLAQFTVSVVFAAMLLSAVFAVCRTRRSVAVGLTLVLSAIALYELSLHVAWAGILGISHLFSIGFLAYTIVVVLRFLFTSQRVSLNTIWASVCVYLLLGVLWANAYSLINLLEPKSFVFALAEDQHAGTMRFGGESSIYPLYYSFVTLSTLGYGDIVPTSPAARMFAAVEAIMGQLYLAVLVARLVGMHIAQSTSGSELDLPEGPETHA